MKKFKATFILILCFTFIYVSTDFHEITEIMPLEHYAGRINDD